VNLATSIGVEPLDQTVTCRAWSVCVTELLSYELSANTATSERCPIVALVVHASLAGYDARLQALDVGPLLRGQIKDHPGHHAATGDARNHGANGSGRGRSNSGVATVGRHSIDPSACTHSAGPSSFERLTG
jgi:hypothetical protein